MALDVYVMPLWRFKAGDFTSPIEATLGIKPTIISGSALRPQPPWHIRFLARLGVVDIIPPEPEPILEERRETAIQEVTALKQDLTALTGATIDWPDTGDVHYNKQYHHPVTLRAFAAWLDHRDALPEFACPPKSNYYEHAIWQVAKPPHRQFPTLIRHSLNTGYFLPVPFKGLHFVEPFTAWGRPFHHHVASTHTILRELAELLPFFDTVPTATAEDGSNPVADARWYAEELQRICTLSVEHRLPVIFYG
ncbi:MAG: hypothetical protein QOE70_2416 [Chthoniobacter sp.]|jgi:hypothetical protein|nr:hypothetical protein [Chthoniobacter sp.]